MSESIKLFGLIIGFPGTTEATTSIGNMVVRVERVGSADGARAAVGTLEDIESEFCGADWEVRHTMREACEWAESEVRRQLEVAVKAAGGRTEWLT